jgi:hypothetical protein
MENKKIADINLRYIPGDGYTITPLNKRVRLRTFVISLSINLYALIQFIYVFVRIRLNKVIDIRRYIFLKKKYVKDASEQSIAASKEIEKNGYFLLKGFCNQEQCDRLVEKLDKLFRQLEIKDDGEISELFPSLSGLSYEDLSEVGERIGLKNLFVAMPELVNIFFDRRLLEIAAVTMGEIPITSFSADRSFVVNQRVGSSAWHRDTYTTRRLQAFIYLEDVDDHHGPLHYVPRTHKSQFKTFKAIYNWEKNSSLQDGRIEDSEIDKLYGSQKQIKFNVKKGDLVIVDVGGFHKGPVWKIKNSEKNKPRTNLHLGFNSATLYGDLMPKTARKNVLMLEQNYLELDEFQKLFTENVTLV